MRFRSKCVLVLCVLAVALGASGVGVFAAASQTFTVKQSIRFQSEALLRERFELVEGTDSVTIAGYKKKDDQTLTELELPDTYRGKPVTEIASEAFSGATGLASVTLPEGLTTIGASAFQSCKGLKYIAIPAGVKELPNTAFAYCDSLTEVRLPHTMTAIGEAAFEDCFNLASVNKGGDGVNRLPMALLSLGRRAFSLCGALSGTVIVPAGVTEIAEGVFKSCISMTSITFEGEVQRVGAQSFRYCKALAEVRLPASLTEIGNFAFSDCTALANVYLPSQESSAAPPAIAEDAFTLSTPALHVPERFVSIYQGYSWCAGLTVKAI